MRAPALLPAGPPAGAPHGAPPAVPLRPVLPLQAPQLPEPQDILAYYRRSIDAGFFSNGGPCARLLGERLPAWIGAPVHAVPVSNCTLGLMAALRAVAGEPAASRRIVLVPSYTFTATACAIRWAGFEPVFVDVEPRGWHLDPSALEEALGAFRGRVAAVMACATFGSAPVRAVREGWRAACAAHAVPLVVDHAPGFGALDEFGRRAGDSPDVEVFSFHATKPFCVGEGGLVTTPDGAVAERLHRIINFGLDGDPRVSVEAGLNAKMSELHAATALAMLDAFEDVLAARRATARRLRAAIGDEVTYQQAAERSPWQVMQLLLPTPPARAAAVELATRHAVQIRTMHEPPLHRHPAFAGCAARALPVTEELASRSLSLPMANALAPEAVTRIAALVHAACDRA